MKETYVTYETSKLLKEKGFDWAVMACYQNSEFRYVNLWNWNKFNASTLCSAPTQQMALRWLREEKNIYVTAVPDIGNSLRFYPAIYVIKGEIPEEYWFEHINSVVEELNKSYGKPQQAIEAALQYVLTNLI